MYVGRKIRAARVVYTRIAADFERSGKNPKREIAKEIGSAAIGAVIVIAIPLFM
jgi:hypothetical protein